MEVDFVQKIIFLLKTLLRLTVICSLLNKCDANTILPKDHHHHVLFESVPNGTMIGETEPILAHLMSIIQNASAYNRYVAPKLNFYQKIVVRVGVNIQTINSVDEKQREMQLNLFIRNTWIDPRLQFDSKAETDFIVAGSEMAERIWKPDLFFPNERHGTKHALMEDNISIRFYANGQIFLRSRYTLVLACDMDFELFPFDIQKCLIIFQSMKYTTEFMELRWMYDKYDIEPVYVKLSKFDLIDNQLKDDCIRYYPSGEFNCLELQFSFKRQLGYHFVETYLPCTMIVCASWISFWLEPKSAPARTALGITSLLTIFGHGNHVKDTLPPVSTLKAIDIWIIVCEFYVFATLVEFMLANYVSRKKETYRWHKAVDRSSRIFFPATFVGFCLLYFVYYWFISERYKVVENEND